MLAEVFSHSSEAVRRVDQTENKTDPPNQMRIMKTISCYLGKRHNKIIHLKGMG